MVRGGVDKVSGGGGGAPAGVGGEGEDDGFALHRFHEGFEGPHAEVDCVLVDLGLGVDFDQARGGHGPVCGERGKEMRASGNINRIEAKRFIERVAWIEERM